MTNSTSTTRQVRYLSGAATKELKAAWSEGLQVGLLAQPNSSVEDHVAAAPVWAADNGKFTTTAKGFDPEAFRAMLRDPRLLAARDTCLFVVAPDDLVVLPDGTPVGNAQGTLDLFGAWAREIKGLGYPVALVAQDGLENLLDEVPWDDLDVLFLGGSDDFKLGEGARICTEAAVAAGKRVHMGRVNSGKRLGIAADFGCDTADGTFLKFAPATNFPRMLRWPNLLTTAPAPQAPQALPVAQLDLAEYDVILLNTSGGKDSSVMTHVVARMAAAQGVADRLVAVHADLGRVEWDGVKELAARQVARYGIRFEVVRRPQGDLLEHVEAHGQWPSSSARFCTSDHKRGQVHKLLTQLVKELGLGRPARILNVMGMRADESPARAIKPVLQRDRRASNGLREVDNWLPIHRLTEAQVWQVIRANGIEVHAAYGDRPEGGTNGMPRLSCSFCVLGSRSSLVRAAMLRPELAAEYLRVEQATGHRFTNKLSMAEIVAEAQDRLAAGELPELIEVERWCA